MRNLITGPAQDLYAQMDEFIEKCHDAMFKVAIVGTVKAGKSTLINALLGDELASTEVTPETSVLAKFCNSNDTDYIKVTFYTSKEWAELTKSGEGREQGFVEQFNRHGDPGLNGKYINKKSMLIKADSRGELKKHIEKWTASTTPEHFYVSEVVIGIKNSVLPDGILLVDTPGLNDPVKYRSEVTRNYIHSAHAVIVCLTADNIENADLCFIGRVQTNLETSSLGNVFIVATQIDRLNKPLEKWPKQKEHFIDTLKVLYKNTPNLLPQRLFGVTAYMQNFINKYRAPGFEGFSDDDEFELESLLNRYKIRLSVFNEKIELLESYTGIHSLLDAMKLYLFNNSRKQLLHAVEVRYDKLSAGINSVLGRIETEQKKIMDAGKSDRKGIGQKISDQLQIIDELKNDRTEFENAMGQLKRGLSEIYNQVKANIERG